MPIPCALHEEPAGEVPEPRPEGVKGLEKEHGTKLVPRDRRQAVAQCGERVCACFTANGYWKALRHRSFDTCFSREVLESFTQNGKDAKDHDENYVRAAGHDNWGDAHEVVAKRKLRSITPIFHIRFGCLA